MHKVGILTYHPRILLQNLGPELCTTILGLRTQTSAIRSNKAHDRSCKQSNSAICGNEATIDHACKVAWPSVAKNARKAARPFVAMKPRSIVHVFQLCRQRACAIDRGFVAADV